MPYFIVAGVVLGFVLTYGFFVSPSRKLLNSQKEDLKAAKELLDQAQQEREQIKQDLADLQYKLKEAEKDLAFERSKNQ